jgi:aryl-alcohol dehydrogenase-like predicted oxidoreductase
MRRIRLACMVRKLRWNRNFVPDRDKMIALIRKAYDMGVNLFDTAISLRAFRE